ncbi:hypothetical protein BDZ89DRAFT_1184157 [Hymenopellis radicata]|nr:hypothetical protein BDZ89DRAFT_1184157 [Hymenopellis radicata]
MLLNSGAAVMAPVTSTLGYEHGMPTRCRLPSAEFGCANYHFVTSESGGRAKDWSVDEAFKRNHLRPGLDSCFFAASTGRRGCRSRTAHEQIVNNQSALHEVLEDVQSGPKLDLRTGKEVVQNVAKTSRLPASFKSCSSIDLVAEHIRGAKLTFCILGELPPLSGISIAYAGKSLEQDVRDRVQAFLTRKKASRAQKNPEEIQEEDASDDEEDEIHIIRSTVVFVGSSRKTYNYNLILVALNAYTL